VFFLFIHSDLDYFYNSTLKSNQNDLIENDGPRINIFGIILNNFFLTKRSCVKINCYRSANWPSEKKGELDRAIKKCLEVICFIFIYKIQFQNSLFLFPTENRGQQ